MKIEEELLTNTANLYKLTYLAFLNWNSETTADCPLVVLTSSFNAYNNSL